MRDAIRHAVPFDMLMKVLGLESRWQAVSLCHSTTVQSHPHQILKAVVGYSWSLLYSRPVNLTLL